MWLEILLLMRNSYTNRDKVLALVLIYCVVLYGYMIDVNGLNGLGYTTNYNR